MPAPLCRLFPLPLLLATAVMVLHADAQESGPKFVFDTGNPPWTGERITLPPSFAPDLGWRGIEEIRFAPGMFEPDSESFFSYVLVFLLEKGSDTSEAALERELLTYYQWLSKAVSQGKGKSVEIGEFTISLDPTAKATQAPENATEVKAFAGKLKWIEPFATGREQTLHLEIHTWVHEGRPVVLSCVSPVAPNEEVLWKSMRDIRAKFRFEP